MANMFETMKKTKLIIIAIIALLYALIQTNLGWSGYDRRTTNYYLFGCGVPTNTWFEESLVQTELQVM